MNYNFTVNITGQLSPSSIANIRKQISDIGKSTGVKIDSTPIKQTGKALQDATKHSNIFGQSIGNVAKKIVGWTVMTGVIFGVIHALKDGIAAVVALDSALVELRKVSNLTADGLKQVVIQASAIGDEVARTTTDVIKATSAFARMGYSVKDSLNLAKQAEMLVNIGDGINDVDTSTAAIISTLKGFNMTADQTSKILDILNEVSNNYAVDTSDLADGITRVSATLGMAGNSLEQTVAMITAATEVLRDSSRASIGLRTIALRLRGVSEEGEDLSDLVPKLKDEFNDIGIALLDSNNNFRSTFDILKDLSGVWGGLTDLQKANLTMLIAGTRQSDVLNSVLINSKTLINANVTAQNSLGSAAKENAIYMESIAAKTELFSKAAQDLWMNAINSDTIKGLVDFGTGLLKIADSLGLVNVAITVLGGIILAKYIPAILSATGVTTAFTVAVASAPPVLLALGSMAIIGGIIALVNAIDNANVSISDMYETLNRNYIQTEKNISELKSLASSYEELAKKENKSVEDKTELLNIQTVLNTKYNDAFGSVNLYTDAIQSNNSAIEDNIELIKEQARIEAENFIKINKLYYEQAKSYLDTSLYREIPNVMGIEFENPEDALNQLADMIKRASTVNAGMQNTFQEWYDEIYTEIIDAQNIIIQYEGYVNELHALETASLPIVTPDLSTNIFDMDKAVKEAVNSFKDLYSAMQNLLSIQEKLNEAEELTPDLINDIVSSFPELIGQLDSLQSAQDAVNNKLTDFRLEMAKSYADASMSTQGFWEQVLATGKISISSLAKLAGMSAQNFAKLESNKAKSAALAANASAGAWAKYYSMSAKDIKKQMDAILKYSSSSQGVNPAYYDLKALYDLYTSLENTMGKISVGGISGGGGGGSSSANKISNYLKGLKALLDAQNDILDIEIDKQKELLDTLKEQYEVEDMITKLQQTQLELTNATNEKNVRLYNPETGKFEWVADPRAVRDAQKAYDDAQQEYTRYQEEKAFEDQIDALSNQKNSISTVIDAINNVIQRGIGLQIKSWDQLIAKLNELGIAYKDISGMVDVGAATPVVTSNAQASAIDIVLQKGDKGSKVKVLQRALNALGYSVGSISGNFDNKTKTALIAFQTRNGVTPTGKLDDATKSQFNLKGYKSGGTVDYTGLAAVHGSGINPEYMYSARDVKSIMSSVPQLLANMSTHGGGDIYIDEMNVNANSPNDWVRQMKSISVLDKRTPKGGR